MSCSTTDLYKARVDKKDEFYTCYDDVEVEVSDYTQSLRGKAVYCNCDDYRVSNFVKYFKDNFVKLGLAHLYASNIDNGDGGYLYSYDGEAEIITPLADGSFDSEACVNVLKLSDVIVTNPPFSLFRKFVDLVLEHNKQLIVVGNQNAITYKNIFKYIMQRKLRVDRGGFKATVGYFYSPYAIYSGVGEKKDTCMRVNGVCWFSSLTADCKQNTVAYKNTYTEKKYAKFDGTDVINVAAVKDIPKDYTGLMGVPITYLYVHNADEYEILGKASSSGYLGQACYRFLSKLGGKNKYHRILIQKKVEMGV